jgi:hypothetical protein
MENIQSGQFNRKFLANPPSHIYLNNCLTILDTYQTLAVLAYPETTPQTGRPTPCPADDVPYSRTRNKSPRGMSLPDLLVLRLRIPVALQIHTTHRLFPWRRSTNDRHGTSGITVVSTVTRRAVLGQLCFFLDFVFTRPLGRNCIP